MVSPKELKNYLSAYEDLSYPWSLWIWDEVNDEKSRMVECESLCPLPQGAREEVLIFSGRN